MRAWICYGLVLAAGIFLAGCIFCEAWEKIKPGSRRSTALQLRIHMRRRDKVNKPLNGWIDALGAQDIPAEIVDWEAITAIDQEDTSGGEAEKLDAKHTIGEAPATAHTHDFDQD
jgi:hypothetical protein